MVSHVAPGGHGRSAALRRVGIRGPDPGTLEKVSLPASDRAMAQRDEFVRDPLADPPAVLAARRLTMAERFELAVNWNMLASELRDGFARVAQRPPSGE